MTTTQVLRAAAAFGAAAGLAVLLALHRANRRRNVEADPAGGWPEWLTRNAPDRTDAVIPAQRHGGTR